MNVITGDIPDLALPRLCTDLQPTGGVIKVNPDDFEVEEIPAYEPSGQGDHLMLWVQKRNLTTDQLVRRVLHHYRVDERDVGVAGNKDRRAITRQMVSVLAPGASLEAPDLGEGVTVLKVTRHTNRLRTGHLRGNRFRIVVRETSVPIDIAGKRAAEILDAFSLRGMPNFFGPQRFGHEGETARWGLGMLRDDRSMVPARVRRSRSLSKLALSAIQSAAYNHYLAERLRRGLVGRVLAGDVLVKTQTGGMFNADPSQLEQDQARMDSREIVHAGPIFGRKTFKATHDARTLEIDVLDSLGLTEKDFSLPGRKLPGTRRRDVVFPVEPSVSLADEGIAVSFTLPKGSYATVLLAQITGNPCE